MAFPSQFKVALVQMYPKPLDPAYNFNHAVAQARDAASKGASLVVLPEYHLTGWIPDSPEFAKLASTAWQYVAKYQAIAKELSVNIVPGTIVTTHPNAEQGSDGVSKTEDPATHNEKGALPLYNVAPFISNMGELLGLYTKANLWTTEHEHLTAHPPVSVPEIETQRTITVEPAHSSHRVIHTPLGPVGILVCWDLAFPEAFRSLIKQGVRLIIIPSYWMNVDIPPAAQKYNKDTESMFLKHTLISRAFENTCAIVFCNVGGPPEEAYIGLSQVTLPLKGVMPGSFENGEPGMRIVEVDMDTIDIAEEAYEVRKNLLDPNWHYA